MPPPGHITVHSTAKALNTVCACVCVCVWYLHVCVCVCVCVCGGGRETKGVGVCVCVCLCVCVCVRCCASCASSDVEVPESSLGPSVFCGVGLTLGLLGVATGTFFFVKGKESATETAF